MLASISQRYAIISGVYVYFCYVYSAGSADVDSIGVETHDGCIDGDVFEIDVLTILNVNVEHLAV